MSLRLPLPRGRFLELEPFAVMGIVNATPDSFYAPSRHRALEARDEALAMEASGAAIVDIGGESTRPGSDYVGLEEELERVVPVVEAIRKLSDLPISVDTRKSEVARAALDAGADVINDVSALMHDPEMARLAAQRGVPVVLMHMLGDPKTMQAAPSYVDCPAEVRAFLLSAAGRAQAAGIARDRVLLDPGIGFGKRLEDNLALIARLDELAALGYPMVVGLSRKAFVGAITARPPEGRLSGSIAAALAAHARGARMFRVHDVAETRDALAVFVAIANAAGNAGDESCGDSAPSNGLGLR